MRTRKVLVALVAAAVLSLAVAGAACAATGGSDQGYRGGADGAVAVWL